MSVVIIVYLLIYFLLVIGAAVTLWRSGLIDHLPRDWVYGSVAVAIVLGILLALISPRPRRHADAGGPGSGGPGSGGPASA